MKTLLIKAFWGMPADKPEENLECIAAAGYGGMEVYIGTPSFPRIAARAREMNLDVTAQMSADTAEELADMARRTAESGPNLINMHTGKDHMTFDEGCRIFDALASLEQEINIPIVHETHRGRLLYAPWVTDAYLQKFPDLKINADFSHWCCVTESMLQFLDPAMIDRAISRSFHIHARVGFPEGPQVNDPRAPENQPYVETHMGWWDRIKAAREADGTKILRVCPEFGPVPYLWCLPYTQAPVADLWDVCASVKDRLKHHWSL